MVDYAIYQPSFNDPVCFMGAPVYDGEDLLGVAVFQLSLNSLNQIMNKRDGMGDSGETYLVGEDLLMRSDALRNTKKYSAKNSISHPKTGKIQIKVVDEAIKGKSGKTVTLSYHGEKVLSAYVPLEILGVKWALMAEVLESEALAAKKALIITNTIIGVIGYSLYWCWPYLFQNQLPTPLSGLSMGLMNLPRAKVT